MILEKLYTSRPVHSVATPRKNDKLDKQVTRRVGRRTNIGYLDELDPRTICIINSCAVFGGTSKDQQY